VLHRQAVLTVLPEGEVAFAGQREHAALPEASLYSPSSHAVQEPPSGPVYAGSHVHTLLPAVLDEFAGQSRHCCGPTDDLNFPLWQEVHVSPSAPVAPTLHVQSVIETDLGPEFDWNGHDWQLGLPVGDHFPSSHSLHTSIPLAAREAE
jgi:hypothetical protein